jgi:outer membrane protein assembly factor BamD (BamD/ComL family)
LNRDNEAVQAWEKAKSGSDKTAVRARCLIGDHFFKLKQFEQAINEFKEIQYRYGNEDAAVEVKAWVAYAFYECARCYLVQASTLSDEEKVEPIKDAIRQFESLLKKYPDDRLAPEAKSQLEKLRQIRR